MMTKKTDYSLLLEIHKICNRLEDKMDGKFEKLDEEVTKNTDFRNQLIGKITVIFAVIGVVFNYLWDYFFNK